MKDYDLADIASDEILISVLSLNRACSEKSSMGSGKCLDVLK
jgi:hypothetical protein